MLIKQDFLYSKPIFEEELRKYQPSESFLKSKLIIIRTLQQRYNESIFNQLTETQIEQSFNEQIFCNIFDYDSQFMRPAGDFHILAKFGPNIKNDFSLGYLQNGIFISKVSVELKGPSNDLENYKIKGKTAIEQSIDFALSISSIDWVIVSNFSNLLLFDKENKDICMKFNLVQINDLEGMKRIIFVIGLGGLYNINGGLSRIEIIKRRKLYA